MVHQQFINKTTGLPSGHLGVTGIWTETSTKVDQDPHSKRHSMGNLPYHHPNPQKITNIQKKTQPTPDFSSFYNHSYIWSQWNHHHIHPEPFIIHPRSLSWFFKASWISPISSRMVEISAVMVASTRCREVDDGVRGVHARPHLVEVDVHRVHGRREVFHVALAGQDDATDVVHLTWGWMGWMDGWRLYGMSMIFHDFLGYFFRENVGGWWGVWNVFFLWFGNWGFHIQKDMYFWARAGQQLESSCWHKSAGEVMLSSHWWQFQIVGPAHTVWQSERHLYKHHEISKFIVYVPSLVIKNGKLQNHRTKWTFIAGYSWENTIKMIALGFRHFPPFRRLCCWSTGLSVRPRRTSVGQRPTVGVVTVRVAF